ncbi:MAG: hypothetical protein ACJATO_002818 [Arenicella sp.]|jgi:hypothetical protein
MAPVAVPASISTVPITVIPPLEPLISPLGDIATLITSGVTYGKLRIQAKTCLIVNH